MSKGNSSSQSQPIVASNGHTEAEEPAAGGFYILSLKWTRGEHLTWWRPDNAGYTADLLQAGVYSLADVLAARDYYDDGEDTLAVPVAIAERFAITRRPVTNAGSIRTKLRRARTRAINRAIQIAPPIGSEQRDEGNFPPAEPLDHLSGEGSRESGEKPS